MRISAALVLVSMLWAGQAGACPMMAATFEEDLRHYSMHNEPERSQFKSGSAQGFVQGVGDSFSSIFFCVPDKITLGDVMTVVERHWKKKMDELDALPSQTCAGVVITAILIDRFPCKSDQKPTPPAN